MMKRTPADLRTTAPEELMTVVSKKRDYCIIDHIGSIDNKAVVNKAYKLATELSEFPDKTYKIKEFCRLLSRNPYEEPTKKQKNFVRFNKHPRQVILIVPMAQGYWDPHKQEFDWDDHQDYDRISSKNFWWAENWAEKADSVTIIACGEKDVEVLDMKEQHPEWFSCKDPVDSVYRRCADIWGAALGWQFSAPLYRVKASEIDVMKYKRHRNPKLEDIGQTLVKACPKLKGLEWFDLEDLAVKVMKAQARHPEWFDKQALNRFKHAYAEYWAEANAERDEDATKTSHSTKVYLNSKTVASEDECKEFFELYKYLYSKGILKESLAEGYQLCPVCGRPLRLEKNSFCIDEMWNDALSDIPEHPDDKVCEHCGKFRIPAKYLVGFERYWDDSFKESDDE